MTITVTPQEFDLLREAVSYRMVDLQHKRNAEGRSASEKHRLREHEAQLAFLADKWGGR